MRGWESDCRAEGEEARVDELRYAKLSDYPAELGIDRGKTTRDFARLFYGDHSSVG